MENQEGWLTVSESPRHAMEFVYQQVMMSVYWNLTNLYEIQPVFMVN